MPGSEKPAAPSASPRSALAGSNLLRARKLILAGDIDAARVVNDAILAEIPDHCGALLQRSRLELNDDHYRLARSYAQAACRVGTHDKWLCMGLLRQLRGLNLVVELRELLAHLPAELAHDGEIAALVSNVLETINDPVGAFEYANQAVQRQPESAELQFAVGIARLHRGDFDHAGKHLRECLRLDPTNAPAWWQLSRLRKAPDQPHMVDALKREIARSSKPHDAALLEFALHRELDNLGDYPGATHALERACTTMRGTIDYSASDDDRMFDALKALPPGSPVRESIVDDAPFTPVFIVGMHRSGTTLLEQMLAGHDEIHAGGEMYDFVSQLHYAADHQGETRFDLQTVQAADGFDYPAIGRGYLESVGQRCRGRPFVTDKLPSNFLNIGFILRALPHAKILHMARDPMETCFSNLREPFSRNTCRYSYDQSELANYYRHYFALMQHWRRSFPGRIHDVTYTALATAPEAEMKRVTSHLGIGYQPSMIETASTSRSVSTASAVQVREKPALPLQPKWQSYREYLTPLAWRLSDVGQRY